MSNNRWKNIRQPLIIMLAAGLTLGTSACVSDFTKKVLDFNNSSQSEIGRAKKSLKYSTFIQQVEQGKIKKVGLSADRTKALIKDPEGNPTVITLPPENSQLIDILTKNSVEIYVIPN